jgi:hypothetical protein
MTRRYALRGDQWERVKKPATWAGGLCGSHGRQIIDCWSKHCYIITEQVFLGVTYHFDLGIFV